MIGEDENGILVLSTRILYETTADKVDGSLGELYDEFCGFSDEDKSKIKEVTKDGNQYHLFNLSVDELEDSEHFKYTLRHTTGHCYSQSLMAEAVKSVAATSADLHRINQSYYDSNLKEFLYTEDCIYTDEDKAKESTIDYDPRYKNYGAWFLRDYDGYDYSYVEYDGDITSDNTSSAVKGIRPAMYLDKDGEYTYKTHSVAPSYVEFGWYYDHKVEGVYKYKPLRWQILDRNSNGFLLLSEDIIDCYEYTTPNPSETVENSRWNGSAMQSILNGGSDGFYGNAFGASDMDRIRTVTVTEDVNPYNNAGEANASVSSDSRVFILSLSQIRDYFGWDYCDNEKKVYYNDDLICTAREYAQDKLDDAGTGIATMQTDTMTSDSYSSIYQEKNYDKAKCLGKPGSQWFVRTAPDNDGNICFVDCDGSIKVTEGANVEAWYGYRPAIYVNPSDITMPIG